MREPLSSEQVAVGAQAQMMSSCWGVCAPGLCSLFQLIFSEMFTHLSSIRRVPKALVNQRALSLAVAVKWVGWWFHHCSIFFVWQKKLDARGRRAQHAGSHTLGSAELGMSDIDPPPRYYRPIKALKINSLKSQGKILEKIYFFKNFSRI